MSMRTSRNKWKVRFWSDTKKAQKVSQKAAELGRDLQDIESLKANITQLPELFALAEQEASMQEELEVELKKADSLLQRVELKTYFTDEHDEAPASRFFRSRRRWRGRDGLGGASHAHVCSLCRAKRVEGRSARYFLWGRGGREKRDAPY